MLTRRQLLKGGMAALALNLLPLGYAQGQRARIIRRGRADRPQVALTFDDLWDEFYALRVGQILYHRGVQATFFPAGRAIRANIERPTFAHQHLYRRLREMGHEFGNHTLTHPNITDLSAHHLIWWEINPWQAALEEALGEPYATVAFRPPPLGIVTTALYDAVLRTGNLPIALWSVDLRDTLCAPQDCAATILSWFERNLANGYIYLQHTVRATAEVLDTQLDLLDAAGLTPVPLSVLISALDEPDPTANG